MDKIVMLSKLYDAGRELLEGKVDLVEAYCDDPDQANGLLEEADGVFLGNQPFRAEMLQKHPNLRLIAKQGSGCDNIDVAAATAAGVPVVLSAGVNARAVAEHVMLLVLAANRNLYHYETSLRQGDFQVRSSCTSEEVCGKTIGLIGFGKIGQAVCGYAKAFGMEAAVYDPGISPKTAEDAGCTYYTELEPFLRRSDTVSIHVPLTPQTRGIIGAEQLAQMKKGAVLVNCARGGTVDEAALYDALAGGHLRAAGLDVFEQEPARADNPLFRLDNVVATPHCAALTRESSQAMSLVTAQGILAVLSGEKWDCVADPSVFASHSHRR